ncbi:MAG TPA: PVC-type heme-binding CxxCH protein [Verrucomicrobiae bacterium]|jgi:putative heme-binding domain-containing protein|nr:PVC-type heme-binding CxxCH protein [Verrucomicrobiae bacterium]
MSNMINLRRRSQLVTHFILALTLTAATAAALAAPAAKGTKNSFADIVRKTEPLTPAQEQKAFHLPPGFEIQLVAAEPDIGKPINMAFDAQGRLWITQSREYPFPAPAGQPARDMIKILSDFDPQGHAAKITTFAQGLNIPIGIYPYKDGAIGYSIPFLYRFTDTNHDGHADTKEPFLGRFGFEKDTHGMTSSFRRGFDGWLYANHGYNNDSVLTAKDGSSIKLNSGNTYRVKIDGSHIEQFAWGRVNPFGLIFDPLGNLYSADCETLPIYEILRGGYYPSFGKPDDGLGFAPPMIDHKHGSTAIAGIVYYAATNFPPDFRENMFVGNVMTCRIDRDSLEMRGSSPWAIQQPDFLVSDDPWFRPVDLQVGPDGTMYVADFYNRIIGHYEVPLDHPGRDRERGRIWRIVYRGTNATSEAPAPAHFDISRAPGKTLIRELGNPNLTIRMLAMSELTDRIGPAAIAPVTRIMRPSNTNVFQKIHGLWVLYRLNALDPKILASAAQDKDARLRVHATRVLAELPALNESSSTRSLPSQRSLVLAALQDPDALVKRTAADALGRHPDFNNLRPLLDARETVPADDTHLLYVLRMSLRNQLLATNIFSRLPLAQWSDADEQAIVDVCLGVPSSESANFLLRHLQNHEESRARSADFLRHIARYLPPDQISHLVEFTRKKFAGDADFQMALFRSVQKGTAQRGDESGPAQLADWGGDIAKQLDSELKSQPETWHNSPVDGLPNRANPWSLQMRKSADGDPASLFISSLPSGEKLTGKFRSPDFTAPEQLTFFMAGHDGPPGKPPQKKNAVRLRAVDTGEVLAESAPPRNDVAQKFTWDLHAASGKKVYVEIVDADEGTAYAWLAVGRFDPPAVELPAADPLIIAQRQQSVAELAKTFKLAAFETELAQWVTDDTTSPETRSQSAMALMAINPDAHAALLGRLAADPAGPAELRESMAHALASANSEAARAALIEALRTAPDRLQVKMALALATGADGAETLLKLAETGKISPRVLQDRGISERLKATAPANYENRVEALTKNLPPADAQRQKLLDQRRAQFDLAKADAAKGAKVFEQNCMVCHSMDNRGGAVGPHLDGVGNRGLERLIEDVLDPSRNVDPSFRYSTVTLKNGDVFAGLQRREEGAVVVFVDATGKETSIAKSDMQSRVESMSSLMPDNFSDALPIADFNNLMAFLLSKGNSPTAKK